MVSVVCCVEVTFDHTGYRSFERLVKCYAKIYNFSVTFINTSCFAAAKIRKFVEITMFAMIPMLADNGMWEFVANRLYYSLFHAILALLVNDGHHSQITSLIFCGYLQ